VPEAYMPITKAIAEDLIGVHVRLRISFGAANDAIDGEMQRPFVHEDGTLELRVKSEIQTGPQSSETGTVYVPAQLVLWYISFSRLSTGILPLGIVTP